jgi:predicted O-methyltransferase YrrM
MLIGILLKAINAKRVLELGTLYGYSSKFICESIPKDGDFITIEKSVEAHQNAIANLSQYSNVECVNADAITFLENYKSTKPFDAIFIDADKTNYSKYLDLCTPLIRKGGLLIADNTLMYGEVASNTPKNFRPKTIEAIREFNEKLVESESFESIIIPTTSGLTLAIKK